MSEDKDKDNYYSMVSLVVVLLILVFFIGRLSKKQPDPIQEPDITHFQKTIDSLVDIGYRRADTINSLKHSVDSLAKVKTKSHKKLKSDIDEIKTFTPTSRLRWRDSVRRSNGL